MSKLLIQESPLTFQPSLAVAIGINEAIVLQQIHYWINNVKNKGYEQDGYKWVYNTYAEWKETNFPFWSENTIQRIFVNLEEMGLVVSIQPMKGKYDRTKYYRIEYTKLEVFEDTKSEVIDDPKLVSSLNESETTTENNIPDNYPLEWYVQHGLPIPPHLIDQNQMAANAMNEFESKLGFSSLPWDSTAEWQKFKKWVIATYSGRLTAWEDYSDWRKAKGKYDAMSNKQIRMNPSVFMDTGWPSFLASSAMYNDDEKTRLL
jgi:hypothetical protein